MATTASCRHPSPAFGLVVAAVLVLLGTIALTAPAAAQSEPTTTTAAPTVATTTPTTTTAPTTTVPQPAAPTVTSSAPTTAPGAPTPPAVPQPEAGATRVPLVLGDSLTDSIRTRLPSGWRVQAQPGLALFEALSLVRDARPDRARCVLIAFGSNDVDENRSARQMRSSIDTVNQLLADHPCVRWTTVKVNGITYYGHGQWAAGARRWNRLVAAHGVGTVLDWNAIAAAHPGYFIGDGLHLTPAGQQAYAALLRRGATPG